MKILILTDPSTNKTNLGQITREVGEIYQENCNITVEWVIEDLEYGNYPIEQYWGGYWGIQQQWMRNHCANIYKRYAEEVVGVVFAIPSPLWKLDDPTIVGDKPVWGWNMSNQFSGYGVQQVRIAQNPRHTTERNINNSVGVMYHESMHDHDGFIFVNTGKTVEPVVGVPNWDNACVHGEHPNWEYIRHKENQEALRIIAPLLREALAKRKAVFETKVGLYQQIIALAEQAIMLLRARIAAQRGAIAILPNNQCTHHVE